MKCIFATLQSKKEHQQNPNPVVFCDMARMDFLYTLTSSNGPMPQPHQKRPMAMVNWILKCKNIPQTLGYTRKQKHLLNLLHFYLYMFEPSHVIAIIFNSNQKNLCPTIIHNQIFSTQGDGGIPPGVCLPARRLPFVSPRISCRVDIQARETTWHATNVHLDFVKSPGKRWSSKNLKKKTVVTKSPGVLNRKHSFKKNQSCVFF